MGNSKTTVYLEPDLYHQGVAELVVTPTHKTSCVWDRLPLKEGIIIKLEDSFLKVSSLYLE